MKFEINTYTKIYEFINTLKVALFTLDVVRVQSHSEN